MDIKWKYVKKAEKNSLENAEKKLGVKFPNDFKESIYEFNAGKPSNDCFDIHSRKECVLDYMLNINENDSNSLIKFALKMWNSGLSKSIVPIALDPFGNIIAYKYGSEGKSPELVFWDHESNKEIFIAESFSIFMTMLY